MRLTLSSSTEVIEDRLRTLGERRRQAQDVIDGIRGEQMQLARYLFARGYSEREIARMAGVTGVAVHHWLNGRNAT